MKLKHIKSTSIQLYETIRNDSVMRNVFITKDTVYRTSILVFFHKTGAGNTRFLLFSNMMAQLGTHFLEINNYL